MHGLSILSRGSLDEKLRWTFSLYDINGDGRITREEMTDIVSAVYDLMGKFVEPSMEDSTIAAKVDTIFQVSYGLIPCQILMYLLTLLNLFLNLR